MTEDDFSGDIFTDGAAKQNLRDNAEAHGLDPDLVAPEEARTKYFAKRSCKKCWGRGTVLICLSPQKKKLFFSKERPTRLRRGRRVRVKGPTPKRLVRLHGFSPANDLDKQWRTSRPEPEGYRENNTSLMLCGCVKSIET